MYKKFKEWVALKEDMNVGAYNNVQPTTTTNPMMQQRMLQTLNKIQGSAALATPQAKATITAAKTLVPQAQDAQQAIDMAKSIQSVRK